MSEIVAFTLAGGNAVLVETDDDRGQGQMQISRGDATSTVVKASEGFEEAMAHITPIAEKMLKALTAINTDLEEVGLEFGIKLSGEVGVIVAKSTAEAHCKVSLKRKRR
jgi:hypothetical protein